MAAEWDLSPDQSKLTLSHSVPSGKGTDAVKDPKGKASRKKASKVDYEMIEDKSFLDFLINSKRRLLL